MNYAIPCTTSPMIGASCCRAGPATADWTIFTLSQRCHRRARCWHVYVCHCMWCLCRRIRCRPSSWSHGDAGSVSLSRHLQHSQRSSLKCSTKARCISSLLSLGRITVYTCVHVDAACCYRPSIAWSVGWSFCRSVTVGLTQP